MLQCSCVCVCVWQRDVRVNRLYGGEVWAIIVCYMEAAAIHTQLTAILNILSFVFSLVEVLREEGGRGYFIYFHSDLLFKG